MMQDPQVCGVWSVCICLFMCERQYTSAYEITHVHTHLYMACVSQVSKALGVLLGIDLGARGGNQSGGPAPNDDSFASEGPKVNFGETPRYG
jgi:hypothetical protein